MSFRNPPSGTFSGVPGVNDDSTKGFAIGDVWVDSSASPRVAYTCTNNAVGAATWSSGGGGGGAPTNAQYLVVALDGTLTNERRLVAGSGITLNDGGAGGNLTIGTVGGGGAAGVGIGGFYGDGSDGALTVLTGTTYTQTAERHFTDVTIQGTGIFKPAGWLTFINGTLTISASGSLNDDGLNAFGKNGGAALAGSRGYLGAASGAGGNGAQTASSGNFNGTTAGSISACSLNNFGAAPAGGKGGNSSGGGLGGNGGGVTTQTRQRWRSSYPSLYGVVSQWAGGSGGGGGGLTNNSGIIAEGGGGGSGGGIVGLWARYISNSGRISANGGNGYEGYVANANGNAGGGGGGGGGLVCVTTDTAISSCGTITAAGGTGGAGFNPGAANGDPGAAGNVVIISYGGS